MLAVRVKPQRNTVKDLPAEAVEALLAACTRRRDLLLFTVLRDTGLRVGEALGLRHEDIDSPHCWLWVRRRVNANGARAKSHERCVPIPPSLVRCYSDYLHEEYGDLDSDYVFVNSSGPRTGQALRYDAVHDLVERLRRAAEWSSVRTSSGTPTPLTCCAAGFRWRWCRCCSATPLTQPPLTPTRT